VGSQPICLQAHQYSNGVLPSAWPSALGAFLASLMGTPLVCHPMAGLSGTSIWYVEGKGGQVIVKRCALRELLCYTQLAPVLHRHGVALPHLYWASHTAEAAWVVLEYLPAALPRTRWLAHPAQLALLHRLHHVPLAALPPRFEPYRPRWDEAWDDALLLLVPSADRAFVAHQLHILRPQFTALLVHQALLSGDPNPLNWGLRLPNTLVLFDWERVGVGPVAFDLAITVPGLGNANDYRQVAASYLACGANVSASDSVETLAQQIACCKVAVMVEFVQATMQSPLSARTRIVSQLQAQLPSWIAANCTAI
jgi:thiamine kinase-like enzyme